MTKNLGIIMDYNRFFRKSDLFSRFDFVPAEHQDYCCYSTASGYRIRSQVFHFKENIVTLKTFVWPWTTIDFSVKVI